MAGAKAVSLVREVRKLLALHQDLGIDYYDQSPILDKILDSKPKSSISPPSLQYTGKKFIPKRTPEVREPVQEKIKNDNIEDITTEIAACTRCRLHEQRSSLLIGQGNPDSKLLIIGDSSGPAADNTVIPFPGTGGELLDKMLAAIGLDRDKVYLTTLIKCFPADVLPDGLIEQPINSCLPFLHRQIDLLSPVVICAMGQFAAKKILGTNENLFRLRGKFHKYQGIKLMPTFAPDYLIKNIEMKKAAWHDLQMIQKALK
jgi:uracil-DNA glycosylase